MKEIELTQGQAALVDDEDFDWLAQWKWCALFDPSRGKFTAFRNSALRRKPTGIYMHRVIMGAGPGQLVNHRDGGPLNNQRANLRVCDWRGSGRAHGLCASNSSGFIGVHRHGKGWWGRVRAGGVQYSCGVWFDAAEAARARDAKAKELFGEFAVLNFKSVCR